MFAFEFRLDQLPGVFPARAPEDVGQRKNLAAFPCPAGAIVALPSTLTGSIGVFGGKVVVRDLMERLGLTTGTVSHGARSLMYSARQGFSDDERAQLDATLDAIYTDFVAKVAQGRGRPVEEIRLEEQAAPE